VRPGKVKPSATWISFLFGPVPRRGDARGRGRPAVTSLLPPARTRSAGAWCCRRNARVPGSAFGRQSGVCDPWGAFGRELGGPWPRSRAGLSAEAGAGAGHGSPSAGHGMGLCSSSWAAPVLRSLILITEMLIA